MNSEDRKRVEEIREDRKTAYRPSWAFSVVPELLAIIDRQSVATTEDVERLAGMVHDAMRQNDGLEVGEIRCAYVVARAALRAMGFEVAE